MKECFAITTYCDSDKKVKILNETIDNLKKFNIDIAIHAHYPLSNEIQNKVNFYFYSSDNPILPRFNIFWHFIEFYKLEYIQHDYAYTIMKQWKELIYLMYEYDVIHFVNYDANITTDLYQLSKNNLDKSIFYENFTTPNTVQTIYFSLLSKDFDYFISILDKEKISSFPSTNSYIPTVELYITSKLNDNFNMIPYNDYKSYIDILLKNEINKTQDDVIKYKKLENGFLYPEDIYLYLTIKDDYNIFIGYYNDKLTAIIYDLKKELKIEIDSVKISISKNTTYFLIDLCNYKDMIIQINNDIIDNEFIEKFIKIESKIIYNL